MPPPSCRPRRTRRWIAAASCAAAAGALLFAARDIVGAWALAQGRAVVAAWRWPDAAPIAPAAVPRPLPAAPVELRWPAATGPDPASWLADRGTAALIVVRDGRLIHERYFGGFTRETAGASFSVAKSVVSVLVGIALHDGHLASVDEPVTRRLPELLDRDPRFGAITLRHLLAMRSGIAFDENYRSPLSDVARWYLSRDLAARVHGLQIADEPDRRLAYQSGNTQLLAMALERAVGEPLARYAERRLWQPMGAEFDASWSVDRSDRGTVKAFCCLHARAVDWARFGQLMLDGGRAGGRQVVPAEWVRASTAVQQRPGAGDAARRNIEQAAGERRAFVAWHWRRAARADGEPGDDYWAQGLLGQFVYVAPRERIVVVRLGRGTGEVFWPAWFGELARLNG